MYSTSGDKSGSLIWLQVFCNVSWTDPDPRFCGSQESVLQIVSDAKLAG